MHPKITIIILNWNGKNNTLECLKSISKITYQNFKTLIVDNGSTDNSIFQIKNTCPNIKIIENKENLGFAKGNNIGIKHAIENNSQYILLLNNDTIVDKDQFTSFDLFM